MQLPLSFMTSVFGMNAKQLDIGTDTKWVEMGQQFKLVCKFTCRYILDTLGARN